MAYKRVKKDKKPFIFTVVGLSLLILISSQSETLSQTGSNLANTILRPIEKVTYSISSAMIEQLERTIGSKETREQVLKLEADNRSLVMENARLLATINREEFLKDEAIATKGTENKYIKAKLINTDVNSMTTHFTIDKGAVDGIEKNDIILQAIGDSKFYTGLVGKVTEVYKTTARVETINSNENDVSFVNANSGDYGVIDIFNKNTIQGFMIDLESKINEKDILLTSGLGGIYPYGIYIGRVATVTMSEDSLRKNITIKSPVDFTHLYRVLVLKHDATYSIDKKPVTKEKKQRRGKFMNKFKSFLILLISFILQTSIFAKIDILGANINILIPATIALSQILPNKTGRIGGLVVGLFEDFLFSSLVGVRALSYYLIGVVSSGEFIKVSKDKQTGLIVCLIASVFNFLLVNGIYYILERV